MASNNDMRLKGRIYVRAGGQMLAKAADQEVTIKKGGIKRDPVILDDNSVRYTETPVVASIECTAKLLAGMTMEEFNQMENVTVTVETDDGWSGVLANAFCAGDLQMGKGGDMKITFYGPKLDENNG
jgi:hypothetical protein